MKYTHTYKIVQRKVMMTLHMMTRLGIIHQCSELGKNLGCPDGKCWTISGNRPLIFLKSGYPNKILVVSGNRETANFEH